MTVKERIKEHEGFRDTVYLDSLGKRTVGYGHLCVEDHWEDGKKYDKEYLDEIFDKDFQNAADQCEDLCNDYELELPETITDVLIEMIFQLGIGNVMKFKKMIAALQEQDFETASLEMLDSRWATQTPSRAEKLSLIVKDAQNN
jgi:lysozyme|tara:strand:- start:1962 stop:2393 length:432 start_codon:yes stop_codon:yes gene_type:complete